MSLDHERPSEARARLALRQERISRILSVLHLRFPAPITANELSALIPAHGPDALHPHGVDAAHHVMEIQILLEDLYIFGRLRKLQNPSVPDLVGSGHDTKYELIVEEP